jgi:hypothetical protein
MAHNREERRMHHSKLSLEQWTRGFCPVKDGTIMNVRNTNYRTDMRILFSVAAPPPPIVLLQLRLLLLLLLVLLTVRTYDLLRGRFNSKAIYSLHFLGCEISQSEYYYHQKASSDNEENAYNRNVTEAPISWPVARIPSCLSTARPLRSLTHKIIDTYWTHLLYSWKHNTISGRWRVLSRATCLGTFAPFLGPGFSYYYSIVYLA